MNLTVRFLIYRLMTICFCHWFWYNHLLIIFCFYLVKIGLWCRFHLIWTLLYFKSLAFLFFIIISYWLCSIFWSYLILLGKIIFGFLNLLWYNSSYLISNRVPVRLNMLRLNWLLRCLETIHLILLQLSIYILFIVLTLWPSVFQSTRLWSHCISNLIWEWIYTATFMKRLYKRLIIILWPNCTKRFW